MLSYQKKSIKEYPLKANFLLRLSGERLEYSNLEDGFTIRFINQNRTFFSSGDQEELTLRQESHLQTSTLQVTATGDLYRFEVLTY